MAWLYLIAPPRACDLPDCSRRATRRLVSANLRTVGYYCRRHGGPELAAQHERERRALEGVRPQA